MFYRLTLLLGLCFVGACATKTQQKLINVKTLKVAEILGYEYTYPSLRVYTWNFGCSDQANFDYSLELSQEVKVFRLYRPESETCYKAKRQMSIDFQLDAFINEKEVLIIPLDPKSI